MPEENRQTEGGPHFKSRRDSERKLWMVRSENWKENILSREFGLPRSYCSGL